MALEENIDNLHHMNKEKLIVWPWMAVIANYDHDGDNNLKEQLIKQGYNPVKVHPLWSWWGHSGFVVVKFGKEWDGFKNAMLFVKDFEVDKHGRKDYYERTSCNKDDKQLYAWIARDEDYNSSGVVGDYLRKNGVLKTVSEIEKDVVKRSKLLLGLETLLEEMTKRTEEIQTEISRTDNSHLAAVIKQNEKLIKKPY